MKVSEIPYKRYTVEEAEKGFAAVNDKLDHAASVQDVLDAHAQAMDILTEYNTAAALSNCRFTLNTKDPFYQAEMDYYDENGPLFSKLTVEFAGKMLNSPYRAEAEEKLGSRVFRSYEISLKTFNPSIVEESQLENSIVTEYSKFMSELVFEYKGEKMPLSVLRGHLEDSDREDRRLAAEAIGKGLGAHADELDDFYDRLVQVRDKMAKKLGYKNFVELGYYRMGRMDYNADMVKRFRDNVAQALVPCVKQVKEKIAGELGLDRVMFYDNDIYSTGETPRPVLDTPALFEAAQEMYDDMNPEVGDFMRSMREAEAFDVEARDGKWGGGYCTCFPKYKQPFILANFNGTSGDVDVITHEFGHALAANFVFKYGNPELDVGGMETAECHSMSMEFFCWKYMEKFFGKNANKYRRRHLLDALSFIPYGVIVDEFQHVVYEHPEMTPAQRKDTYRELEKKYRPYLNWDGIPYLEEGTRWQYQMHIYESPFYYIDYCLAQTVAIGFLLASCKDYDKALQAYLHFAKQGGTKAFEELIEEAGLASPFKEGSLQAMAEQVMQVVDSIPAE